ncbi:hypothetical protein ACG7TL_007491 [Trametes sanguinea]
MACASANRRIALAHDAAERVRGPRRVSEGLVGYPEVFARCIPQELPFMATENCIMAIVKMSRERPEAHEKIRVLSHEAAHHVKQLRLENDLIERVRADPYFDPIKGELDALLDPRSFIGRAPEQVDKFLADWVRPALVDAELQAALGKASKAELNV